MTKQDVGATFDREPHSARMLEYLKEVFRSRRMRYADVAVLMGVSEKSIKRYMAGRGVTLTVLERLCAAAGLSLNELSSLAQGEDEAEIRWTDDKQEAVLAAEPKLAIVLALLTTGWTAARILRDGLASPSDLEALLIRLDRLGIIKLYPSNKVIMRARIRPIDTASEPLRRVITQAGTRVMANLNLHDPASTWRLDYARLGPASVARVAGRLDALLAEVRELSRQDMDLKGDQVKWYAICGMLTPHEVLGLAMLKER